MPREGISARRSASGESAAAAAAAEPLGSVVDALLFALPSAAFVAVLVVVVRWFVGTITGKVGIEEVTAAEGVRKVCFVTLLTFAVGAKEPREDDPPPSE